MKVLLLSLLPTPRALRGLPGVDSPLFPHLQQSPSIALLLSRLLLLLLLFFFASHLAWHCRTPSQLDTLKESNTRRKRGWGDGRQITNPGANIASMCYEGSILRPNSVGVVLTPGRHFSHVIGHTLNHACMPCSAQNVHGHGVVYQISIWSCNQRIAQTVSNDPFSTPWDHY